MLSSNRAGQRQKSLDAMQTIKTSRSPQWIVAPGSARPVAAQASFPQNDKTPAIRTGDWPPALAK
jgi:hypothetical protein